MRLLLLLLLVLPPLSSFAARIKGRVVSGETPVAGIRVEAHGSLDFSGEPVSLSAPTDEEGRFELELPPGLYSFFARDGGRKLFAFCGRNPVAVGNSPVWAGLQATEADEPTYSAYDDEFSAAVEGVVMLDGKPFEGAYVALYLDAAEDLKGQGYRLSLPTGEDGSFFFDNLPESDYYIVARKRESGGRVGPILEGDALALYPGNPVHASAGRTARVALAAVRKLRESPESEAISGDSEAAFRGKVTDGQGLPVAGVHVFAYSDRVIGHKRPAALSPPTGKDGVFTVRLKKPGTYYVGARQRYGDSPAPGELFGMYEKTADHGLYLASGEEAEDIRIVVEPISFD